MNGHFSSVGDEPSKAHYEHGIQVIDGDKEFKYAPPPLLACPNTPGRVLTGGLGPPAPTSTSTLM